MHHVVLNQPEPDSFDVAILIKQSGLKAKDLCLHYTPLVDLNKTNVVGFSLAFNERGQAPVTKVIRPYLNKLMPALKSIGVRILYVCDGAYFKELTGVKKVDPHYGYVLPCTMKGYEDMKVVLSTNYQSLFFNPAAQDKIDLANVALQHAINGTPTTIGKNVLKDPQYIHNVADALKFLDSLYDYPELSLDLETFSLNFWEAGIGTFAFAWDENSGGTVVCDRSNKYTQEEKQTIKQALKQFLSNYKGTVIYHNGGYDIKVLVYELFMEELLDREGMLEGIQTLTENFEDTKLIAYLATNSTTKAKLSLKDLAHEHAGNYAHEDIEDITKIPIPELVEYNLIDAVCTQYVFKKFYPIMVQDEQLELYETIFKPSVQVILQMELTGLPLNYNRVREVTSELNQIKQNLLDELFSLDVIKEFQQSLRLKEFLAKNAEWKRKQEALDYFDYVEFNPNSNQQVQKLLYDFMGFEVIDLTKAKQPSTKFDTIKKLKNHTTNPEYLKALDCLMGLSEVTIILDNFMNAFLNKSIKKSDGWHYLHGNFNLGGTVSGRLSSSGPNLQNIPSTGSKYAKLVKSCIQAPPGWIFAGPDFSSLEDRISALTTKDPNKLAVYQQGLDGHSYRAAYYYSDQMPEITEALKKAETATKFWIDKNGEYHCE